MLVHPYFPSAQGIPAERAGGASANFIVRPNRSLPVAGLLALFALLSALPLTIGIGFALAGVWMVLPFAGLEVALLGALTWMLYRHIDDCELIVVEADRVRVLRRAGTRESRHDFPRYWARVVLDHGPGPRGPSRLRIGSHGRYVDIAADINETDRRCLARELRHALRPAERPRSGGSHNDSDISGDPYEHCW